MDQPPQLPLASIVGARYRATMHSGHAIGFSLLATALLIGCKERSAAETPQRAQESVTRNHTELETSQLSGSLEVSVSYRERMMLPEGSTLRVTLADVSKADAPAAVIAEKTLTTTGGPPYVVTLTYDPKSIENRARYAVSARIEHDGALLFATDTSNAVLTGGAPKEKIEVVAAKAQAAAGG